jgi:hypothetical protein
MMHISPLSANSFSLASLSGSIFNGFIIMHYRTFTRYSFEDSNLVNAVCDIAGFGVRLLYCLKTR